MRTFLLSTCSAVAATLALGLATPAAAQFTVTFSGDLWVDFGYTSVDEDDARAAGPTGRSTGAFTGGTRDVNSQQRGRFNLIASQKADNGLTYGVRYRIRMGQTNLGNQNTGFDYDKSFIFVDGNFGRVELGHQTGVGETMFAFTASSWGTGGADGFALDFSPGSESPGTIYTTAVSDTPSTRINYYSPRFSGFQFGLSYATETGGGDVGRTVIFNKSLATFTDATEVAVGYDNSFSGARVRLGANYMFGAAAAPNTEDLNAWSLNGRVDYQGFGLSLHYVNNGESGSANNANVDDQTVYAALLQYTIGQVTVGGSYAWWENQNRDEIQQYAIGATYTVAPGLLLQPEISFVDWDRNTGRDIDSTAAILRTRVNF